MITREGSTFADRALAGFALADPGLVRWVPSGVIARGPAPEDRPALVIGGGSGHFPAFAGYVGEGAATAAVHGDVFASPSTAAIVDVVRSVGTRAGVILGYGNYAGDRLNFGAAATTLRAEGHDVRELVVTDDIASSAQHGERRGIAGDVVVFKICGAALAAGYGLDAATVASERANRLTRTLGVAFSGCTIPGSDRPLFTVESGTVAIGMGIHGEPGIDTLETLTEDDLAALLVARTVDDLPPDASHRVAVLLNGMGATNAEALFSVWPAILEQLAGRGYDVVAPLVGSFVSSLDMSGLSLTICALDEELESLWLAPVRTAVLDRRVNDTLTPGDVDWRRVDAAPLEDAGPVAEILGEVVAALVTAEAYLGELDALAGDGDHGRGMLAGARAAQASALPIADVKSSLEAAGRGWAAKAGGTSGALWGAMLEAAGQAIDPGRSFDEQLRAGVAAARSALVERGGAEVGDKTMLDAIAPFAEVVAGGGEGRAAWRAGVIAAQSGAEATRELTPLRGRSKTHPGRSLGHPDPGAVSFALIVDVVDTWLENEVGA